MKIAIYRVLFGNYDYSIRDPYLDKNIDYFLFTDDKNINLKGYNKNLLKVENNLSLLNRKYKINTPEILYDYDITIYIDYNIRICRPIYELINEFIDSNSDIALFRHPYSASIDEEVDLILSKSKSNILDLTNEINYFKEMEVNPCKLLTDNSILFRKNTSKIKELNRIWYSCVSRFSGRDQISLPYIRSMLDVKEYIFDFSPRDYSNKFFVVFPHRFFIGNLGLFIIHIYRLISKYILMKVKYISYIKSNIHIT